MEAVPHDWAAYLRLCGGEQKLLLAREQRWRNMGSDPEHWRAAFEPVPIARFLSVEVYKWARWNEVALDRRNGHVVIPASLMVLGAAAPPPPRPEQQRSRIERRRADPTPG